MTLYTTTTTKMSKETIVIRFKIDESWQNERCIPEKVVRKELNFVYVFFSCFISHTHDGFTNCL